MRANYQELLADAFERWVNRCMLALLPAHRRAWGHALIAEQHEMASRRERLNWAVGGLQMSFIEWVHCVFNDRPTWAAGLAFGVFAAFVDLNSATRWPYILLLCGFTLILAYWQPKWAWRWILPLGLSLPIVAVVTKDWGPYAIDRFDVFYGLVPCVLGTLAGVAMRGLSSRLLHHSAGR